jgi:hypothetical protein
MADDFRRGAGFIERLARLGEFDLFEAVGDQNGHIQLLEYRLPWLDSFQ